jgi:hypothetical protein
MQMFEIIKELFDICLFKKGPQDLPYSGLLLKFLIGLDLGVSFLLFNIEADSFKAFLQALTGILLVLLSSLLTVYLGKRPQRFYQTASALVGVDALVSFFALPGMATLTTGYNSLLAFGVMVMLMVWHWAITGHVIRHTLGQPLAFGLGLAFLYIVASYQIMAFLFPEVSVAN